MSLPRYPGCRDSGVDWLGCIPSHWKIDRLKRRCRVFPSNVDKKSVEGEALVRLCNYTDVYYSDSISSDMPFMEATASDEQIRKFTLMAGDTIFTKDSETANDIGIASFVPVDVPGVVCGYHLSIARPYRGVNGAYVKRLFDAHYTKARFAVLANGLTRVSLNQYAVDNIELPWPPLEEQVAIVEFLDRETAKIDALIAEQEKLLALLAEKHQASISHAVTRGLNPNATTKSTGIPWLGEVPKHWEVVPFRSCVDFQEGPGIMAVDFYDEGIPLLRVSGVQGDWATLDGCNYLDPKRVEERWNHFRVEEGDLLISASASMGTVCEVGPEVVGSIPYTGIIRLKGIPGRMTKSYIRHLVVSGQFLTQIDLLKAGATIQHFGPTHLSQMVVAKPPVEEQAEIAMSLDALASKYSELERQARSAIGLLKERRSALISAAVTGKIDVRSAVTREAVAA